MKLKWIIPIFCAILLFACFESYTFGVDNGFRDGQNVGYYKGFNEGYACGNSTGYEAGYAKGNLTGYNYGYSFGFESGNRTGFKAGYDYGYSLGFENGKSEGFAVGNKTGYEIGYDHGYSSGRDEGYAAGFSVGNETGYRAGYLQGVIDGAGRGWNIRDPTYEEMLNFIAEDQTDKNQYIPGNYTCWNFAADVKSNAFKAGYRCGLVYLEFPNAAHAIVCFNTTDRGLIFIEPQSDEIVTPKIGSPYWDRTKYLPPPYNDTIIYIAIVW